MDLTQCPVCDELVKEDIAVNHWTKNHSGPPLTGAEMKALAKTIDSLRGEK